MKQDFEGKFIYYDEMYWLVHQYNKDVAGDGWFASPLSFPKPDIVKVIIYAGNWCYASNGAFVKNPKKDVMKKAYQSYMKHLLECKKAQKRNDIDTTIINNLIKLYDDLINLKLEHPKQKLIPPKCTECGDTLIRISNVNPNLECLGCHRIFKIMLTKYEKVEEVVRK